MAVRALARLAAQSPIPVFVAAGAGAGLAQEELNGVDRLVRVSSPRRALVLIAVGRFPGELGTALARLHDQLPSPRASVWWRPPGVVEVPAALTDAEVVIAGPAAGVGRIAATVGQALLTGARPGSPDVLPDVPPALFEGRGDHGQGGEGMMGGVPYGRPMAMTGPDRDGLVLDRSEATMGPFLAGLPPGLVVDVVLQGGVVQQVALRVLDDGDGPGLDPVVGGFAVEPGDAGVALASTARRRHVLRWLSGACWLADLVALSARVACAASSFDGPAGDSRPADQSGVVRRVRRSGLVRTWRGFADDAAAEVLDRRLDELAHAPQDVLPSGGDDPPWRSVRPGDGLLEATADRLLGLDWSDALTLLWSLDLVIGAPRPGRAPQ